MPNSTSITKLIVSLIALTFACPLAFAGKHPRRAEVKSRENTQIKRINQGVQSGTLTKEEGKELRGNVQSIKKEARANVKENGGYLTKDQKKELNQDLNQNSKDIYQQKHDGAAPTAPVTPAE